MDAYKKDSLNLRTGVYSLDINKTDSASFGSGRLSLVIRQNTDLAYHLLDFTVDKIQNTRQVQALWKTENEGNYTNFTVERSTDNDKEFEVLGSVKANGSGSYSFTDKNPGNGKNFYRLKQEDLNSVISYSKIAEVQFFNHDDDKLHIYPNPATYVINLDLNAKTDGREPYDIQVSNCYGFIVKQTTASQTNWQTNISNLSPGTYLVRVLGKRDRNLIGQAKFVKL